MESQLLEVLAKYGLPTVLLFVLIWRQRENERDCREDRNRLWEQIVKLATKLPPDENTK